MIGSAPPVVANPADITSYYRAMYDERRWGGCAKGGRRGSFEQKGCLSCAKREACIRRLCSTVVYDYLLTARVFLRVSPPFVPRRTSDRRVSTYGDLGCSLSGLLVACETTPGPRTPQSSARGCIGERQRRVFTSLRSHNSGRQTGKPFFLVSVLILLHPFRFPQALLSSTFLAISVKYFKDRSPIVHPLARRLRFFRGGCASENV